MFRSVTNDLSRPSAVKMSGPSAVEMSGPSANEWAGPGGARVRVGGERVVQAVLLTWKRMERVG